MRMDQLHLLFESGDLLAAEILSAPLEPGPAPRWICEFRRRNGTRVAMMLTRKRQGRNQVRIFNTVDAAFAACRQVGFRAATVSAA